LNDIRNRYKAYFHIDGHGFCYSKDLSKPSTPIRYQIDKAFPIFNRKSFKDEKGIQARPISSSYSPQSYNSKEQQSQYYSLLNRNKKCISNLQEIFIPDYEYFQCTKEGNIQDLPKNIETVTTCDSCDGIDYVVFYHKEKYICKSTRALLAKKVLNESDSKVHNENESYFKCDNENETCFRNGYGNENYTNNFKCQNEPYLRSIVSCNRLKESRNKNDDHDGRALMLLNTQEFLDEFNIESIENKKGNCLQPLKKALSPILKLIKNNNHQVIKENERCLIKEIQHQSNEKDKNSNNDIYNFELPPRNADNEKINTFQLNFGYISQDQNSEVYDMTNLDMLQSQSFDEASINPNNNESCQKADHSIIYSSTPSSTKMSPKCIGHQKQQNLELLFEKPCKKLEDVDIVVGINKKVSSICQNRHLKIEETLKKISSNLRGKLLSIRVQKLDIKKQIYLSYFLDKLEIAHVSRSVDLFCD